MPHRPGRVGLVSWAALAIAAACFVMLHQRAGLTFPTPWPDEAHFLWPAHAFSETGSLFAPQLHPHRPLLWMPPGYSLIVGIAFRIGGASIEFARWSSAVAVLCAVILAARWWSPDRPWLTSLTASWLLLTPEMIVAGNIARMEAFELLAATAAFGALARGQRERAVAWFSLAILIHPVGAAFMLASVGLWRGTSWKRTAMSRALLGVSVLGAVGLLVWTSAYAGGFLEDVAFQLNRKSSRDLLAPWLDRRSFLAIALIVAVGLVPRDRTTDSVAAFAIACLVIRNVGQEMWYAVYDVWFYATAAVALGHVVLRRLASRPPRTSLVSAIATVIGILSLGWVHRPRPPGMLRWRGMSPAARPYVSTQTLDALTAELSGRGPVEVLPHGDAALFLDRPGVMIVDPVRYDFAPSLTLVHLSPYHLRAWQPALHDALARGSATRIATDEGGTWHLVVSGLGKVHKP